MPSVDPISILIVDDDEIILLALRESFACKNYRVVTTSDPVEALDHVNREPFAVIISDQRMAAMNGLEFFKRCKTIQPHASRILITGVITLKTVINAVNKGEIYRFVAKPWIREELLEILEHAVERYQLIASDQKRYEETLILNQELKQENESLMQELQKLREQASTNPAPH